MVKFYVLDEDDMPVKPKRRGFDISADVGNEGIRRKAGSYLSAKRNSQSRSSKSSSSSEISLRRPKLFLQSASTTTSPVPELVSQVLTKEHSLYHEKFNSKCFNIAGWTVILHQNASFYTIESYCGMPIMASMTKRCRIRIPLEQVWSRTFAEFI